MINRNVKVKFLFRKFSKANSLTLLQTSTNASVCPAGMGGVAPMALTRSHANAYPATEEKTARQVGVRCKCRY